MSRLRLIASLVMLGFASWILVPSFISSTRSSAALAASPAGTEVAIFAGGCFWCVESDFDKVPGVISTTSGYIGGKTTNPTYRDVSGGSTGHAEAVKIVYDPKVVSFDRLLFVFWRTVDPVTRDAQFCDYGTQYRTAIFFMNDVQRQKALASKAELEKAGKLKRPIVTEIVQAGPFFAAEDYHQDYYKKNPFQYNLYRFNCGRDARLDELWGKEAGGGTH